MKKNLLVFSLLLFLGSCSSQDIVYKPRAQQLPPHIKSLSVRTFVNKTPQFGLEEKLSLAVTNEFLKNGEYSVTNEKEADAIISGEIEHYILTPIEYDVNMVTTVYKLDIIISVSLLDKTNNSYLWTEPALQAVKIFSAANRPGGISEERARELLWELLAKDIVKRTVEGFGSVSSVSEKKLPGRAGGK